MRSPAIGTSLGVFALVAAFVYACSAPDPGALVIEPHHGRSRTGPESDDASFGGESAAPAEASSEGAAGDGAVGEGGVGEGGLADGAVD